MQIIYNNNNITIKFELQIENFVNTREAKQYFNVAGPCMAEFGWKSIHDMVVHCHIAIIYIQP